MNIISLLVITMAIQITVNGQQTVSVTTTLGTFQGRTFTTTRGYNMTTYLGVPYAQTPPSPRFSKTAPLTSLNPNPYDASSNKPPCARWGADGKNMDTTSSEDCLYMKILTPLNVQCCLPVMFWIQGGGFNDGGYPQYDNNYLGDNFVSKGVVIVQVDHRQGPFGFFTTGESTAPGNWGVWDALEALKFVRTNINAFGGDLNKITIMGHESGAVMAELLSLSPMSKGLYSSMILIDSTVFDPSIIKNDAVNLQRSQRLAVAVNCDNTSANNSWDNGRRDQVLSCLRTTPTTAQLVSAIGRGDITTEPGSIVHNYFWRPRVDGTGGVLPNGFESLAAQRAVVPTLMGVMKDDWLLELLPFLLSSNAQTLPANFNATYNTQAFVTQTCQNALPGELYGATNVTSLTQLCTNAYANNGTADSTYYWTKRAGRVSTGLHLLAPMCKTAQFMRSQGNAQVYMYSFDYDRSSVSDYWQATGGARNLEVELVENFFPVFTPDQNDMFMADVFSDMLTNFAKNQNPTPAGYTKARNVWITNGATNCYFSINQNSTMQPRFYEADCQFWINSGALN